MTDKSLQQKVHLAPHNLETGVTKVKATCVPPVEPIDTVERILTGESLAKTSVKAPTHSMEIEVLKTNIPVIEWQKAHQPWEPTIVIKEGTIVV